MRASMTTDEFRDQRRSSLERAITRRLTASETAEYLSPWDDGRRIRSWMAMAAAADDRHTLDLLPELRDHAPPSLLIWGEHDEFQPVTYAERFAGEVPSAELVRVPGARHIPVEDDPDRVAGELLAFLEMITASQQM